MPRQIETRGAVGSSRTSGMSALFADSSEDTPPATSLQVALLMPRFGMAPAVAFVAEHAFGVGGLA